MVGTRTLLVLGIYLFLSCATSDETGNGSVGNRDAGLPDTGKRKSLIPNEPSESLKTVAEGVKVSSDELITSLNGKLPVEREAAPSVHPRKGVKSPISARKGVESVYPTEEPDIPVSIPDAKTIMLEEPKDIQNKTSTSSTTERTPYDIDLMKSIDTNETKIIKPTEKAKINKKFKPKPTVTIAGASDVQNVKPSLGVPTKIPPLGMSSKIDYVVPVIITILVLPLFVLFVIFLYRNGRECWEKRHYRRMDFLIDGMYNE
ncbi:uncharacterized protein LOC107046569 [Diachasma alloeum]|uniref:uncharacterized protein LOC107046569 n=1 Tax=Diachasma alloeum TaxID=454923 RepID=UPI000738324E|nr:uncharacterized protein LOC107046569 [Diachasma alloeum]